MNKDLISEALRVSYPQATDTPLAAYNKVISNLIIAISAEGK